LLRNNTFAANLIKVLKKVLTGVVLVIFVGFSLLASESEAVSNTKPAISLFAYGELVSTHVWRGGKSGNAPAFEPMLELSRNDFTLGSWAAVSFDGLYREVDLYLTYSVGDFTLGLYDYYCPPAEPGVADFSNFSGPDTYHLYSFDAVYQGSSKLPVKLTASVMMYGMDVEPESGDANFSTYLEAVYVKQWKQWSAGATLGFTTHRGIYADKAALVHSELNVKRKFSFKEVSIPVFAKTIYNPYADKFYLLGGVAFQLSHRW
jgi:hypothetical protein